MKKKLLAAIIAAALAVSLLAGCGAQGNTNSSLFLFGKGREWGRRTLQRKKQFLHDARIKSF